MSAKIDVFLCNEHQLRVLSTVVDALTERQFRTQGVCAAHVVSRLEAAYGHDAKRSGATGSAGAPGWKTVTVPAGDVCADIVRTVACELDYTRQSFVEGGNDGTDADYSADIVRVLGRTYLGTE